MTSPNRHVISSLAALWVVCDQGIGVRTGDTWQLTPLAELELDSSTKLAFDSEQVLWRTASTRS